MVVSFIGGGNGVPGENHRHVHYQLTAIRDFKTIYILYMRTTIMVNLDQCYVNLIYS
jgi:hypothetical protein